MAILLKFTDSKQAQENPKGVFIETDKLILSQSLKCKGLKINTTLIIKQREQGCLIYSIWLHDCVLQWSIQQKDNQWKESPSHVSEIDFQQWGQLI